jgi:hypothetical protein
MGALCMLLLNYGTAFQFELHTAPSHYIFRHKLKTHLFAKVYPLQHFIHAVCFFDADSHGTLISDFDFDLSALESHVLIKKNTKKCISMFHISPSFSTFTVKTL